jgi:hypothetical protein
MKNAPEHITKKVAEVSGPPPFVLPIIGLNLLRSQAPLAALQITFASSHVFEIKTANHNVQGVYFG